MRRVLVTDAGRGSAIAIIRSLGRSGLEVVAADSDPRSAGFRSRYAADRLVYPDPKTAADAVVETLRAAAVEQGIDLIVPVSDDVGLPLSAAREQFEGVCALALPDPEALAVATDKHATLQLARHLGVPVPQTALAHTAEEALDAARGMHWPIVVKPVASRVYREGAVDAFEVVYADSPEALGAHMRRLEGRCGALLQEYVSGEGHGVELLAQDGTPLAVFQHRRLHEVPITGGASSLRESVPVDPVLYAHAARLLGALRWTGLAMVEFRVGPRGAALMEINGRVWGSLPLAVKCGVDFPLALARLYLPDAPSANGATYGHAPAAVGVRSRNVALELVWIASVLRKRRRYAYLAAPRRREAIRAALRLPLPGDGYDVLSLEDPLPGLVGIARVTSRLARKVRGAS
jgi:predicted ATP-grasp superfamily ATP-dependent carboligase